MPDPAPAIVDARLEPYAVPFVRPWRSARGAAAERRGWLVRLHDARGVEAVGEAAPWPDAGTETPAECAAALARLLPPLVGASAAAALVSLPPALTAPAARCGVEAALLSLQAAATGRPVRRLLAAAAADSVAVNAACGGADDALAASIDAAAAAGYRVFKVKLGVAPWREELAALRALGLPRGGALRLDANGAWDAATARRRLLDLAGLPVECVEEPLAKADPAALAALQAECDFPLALDESLAHGAAALVERGCPVRRLVLKPMVLGGAVASVRLARRAAAVGLETVVTTTLEAAPGRWLAAAVAAATGSPLAHGLDTGRWLAADLGAGPEVVRGRIDFPPD